MIVRKTTSILFALVLAVGLAACSSAPPAPTGELSAADAAIRQAEDARVADYASFELGQAREKIGAARALAERATKEKDEKAMIKARQLAEESRSDAELAIAKGQQAKAEAMTKQMQLNNETLQQEIQRRKGN